MVRCSIRGCKSDSEKKTVDLSFHSFPSQPELRNLWIKATGRTNWIPKRSSKICSNHFKNTDLIKLTMKTRISLTAVPKMTSYHKNKRTTMKNSNCIVPLCRNTDPIKCYFPVPKEQNLRIKWCKLMRRNPAKISFTSNLFCCEDHFDLDKDIVSTRGIVRLKHGVVPHKFACQTSYKPPSKVPDTKQANEIVPIAPTPRDLVCSAGQQENVAISPTPHLVCSAGQIYGQQENVVGCSIRKCPSRGGMNGYIQFFTFPKDEVYAQQWLQLCESNTTTENGRVCSLHFTFNDYWKLQPKVLKETAVPSLNIDDIDVDKLLNPYFT